MSDYPYRYAMFGLVVQSDIELPVQAAPAGQADLSIRRMPIDHQDRHAPDAVADLDDEQPYFGWETVGGFRILSNTLIAVDPNPGVSDNLVSLPLLGTVIAALLQRRGLMVLHASAAAIGGHGIGLLGDKGAGKSTTVGALVAAGHQLLSDDVVALEFATGVAPTILPAYAQLKLWDEAVGGIGLDSLQQQERLHPSIDKRQYRLTAGFADAAVPLGRLYILTRGDEASIRVPDPQDCLSALLRFSYMGRFGQAGLGRALKPFFGRSASLAALGLVRVLQVPHGLDRIPHALSIIEQDLQ